MKKINCDYKIKDDLEFILEATRLSVPIFSELLKMSRITCDEILKNGKADNAVCEKIYSFAYKKGLRINRTKEELLKETSNNVLFHGSKFGIEEIHSAGSRKNCDFGGGFYLGETYEQALSFVYENAYSSVYSFQYDLKDLNIKRFKCDLDWMLTICYFRGSLKEYVSNARIIKLINELNDVDVIIAPIADNKMFYIMSRFIDGDINADVALHSLSAANLGVQYVFKSEKSIERLIPIEKYYISDPERHNCIMKLKERSFEIDTKLRLAKREFKNGPYIEDILP